MTVGYRQCQAIIINWNFPPCLDLADGVDPQIKEHEIPKVLLISNANIEFEVICACNLDFFSRYFGPPTLSV